MSTGRHTDLEALRLEHLPVWEAIPWVVNGRATPAQARLVAAHVAQCEDCRAELDLQTHLQQAMGAAPDAVLAAPDDAAQPADVEAGLQRLLVRLDDVPEQQPRPAPVASGRRLTLALAAAVVVQAVGLGVLSLRQAPADSAAYRTLSDSAPPAAARATLRVLPDASMTLSEWQATLQALDLHVVQGPNAAGAYALAPTTGMPVRTVTDVVARLRATPGIRLAEQIGPGS
jgi:hypothetical protein